MKWILLLAFFLMASAEFASATSLAETKPAPAKKAQTKKKRSTAEESEQVILSKYSLEQLNAAGTYLMAVYEASLGGKKTPILPCDPDPNLGQMWLSGPLHALIDAKAEIEASALKQNLAHGLKRVQKKWRECAAQCQCSSYLAVTALIESQDKLLTDMTGKLTEENNKQSTGSAAACAAKQTWFCGSPLEEYLKSNSSP